MTDSNADNPATGTGAPAAESGSDAPTIDTNAFVAPPDEPLIDIAASDNGFETGDSLVQALAQLGDGHSTVSLEAGSTHVANIDSSFDMSDVGAIADDLGNMLDQLGPSLDALISEVNLFDIAIAGDTFGDA